MRGNRNKIERYQLLRSAIRTFGEDMQMTVAIEEMSELIKEICKRKRGADNLDALTEEIADVRIMLEQLEMILKNKTDVDLTMEDKLDRLARRIKECGTA